MLHRCERCLTWRRFSTAESGCHHTGGLEPKRLNLAHKQLLLGWRPETALLRFPLLSLVASLWVVF
jgi:hypothetical protein